MVGAGPRPPENRAHRSQLNSTWRASKEKGEEMEQEEVGELGSKILPSYAHKAPWVYTQS